MRHESRRGIPEAIVRVTPFVQNGPSSLPGQREPLLLLCARVGLATGLSRPPPRAIARETSLYRRLSAEVTRSPGRRTMR